MRGYCIFTTHFGSRSRLLALSLIGFLSGCATESGFRELPPPVAFTTPTLSLAQIEVMTARGVSDEVILTALGASHGVYRLKTDDVIALQEAKVSKAVIDYMLSTPLLYPSQPQADYSYGLKDPWLYWCRHDGCHSYFEPEE